MPPHARVRSPRPHTGPQQQASGTDSSGGGGGGSSRPGHAPQVPIASNPRPPARLDRRKAFLWEPPGCHVTFPAANRVSPPLSVRPPPPPPSSAPPLPCSGPARARCFPRAPWRTRATPGTRGRGGGAGAEGEQLGAEEEAAPG